MEYEKIRASSMSPSIATAMTSISKTVPKGTIITKPSMNVNLKKDRSEIFTSSKDACSSVSDDTDISDLWNDFNSMASSENSFLFAEKVADEDNSLKKDESFWETFHNLNSRLENLAGKLSNEEKDNFGKKERNPLCLKHTCDSVVASGCDDTRAKNSAERGDDVYLPNPCKSSQNVFVNNAVETREDPCSNKCGFEEESLKRRQHLNRFLVEKKQAKETELKQELQSERKLADNRKCQRNSKIIVAGVKQKSDISELEIMVIIII